MLLFLLLHVWSLRWARVSATCVKISIRILYVKFLYIVWLLVCVLTVLGVSCFFLFFVACLVLECLLDWTGSSSIIWFCRSLLYTSCIISNIGLWVSMYVSFICNPSLLILYIYIYIYPVCSGAFLFSPLFKTFVVLVIFPYVCPVFNICFKL
jgi:hypothetical protein